MKAIPFKEIYGDFLSLIFPNICLNCKRTLIRGEEVLCMHCRWNLPETRYHEIAYNPLMEKFSFEPKVDFVYAYLHYNRKGIAKRLIHTLKYGNSAQIGTVMGLWYGSKLKDASIEADMLLPVPIHRKRLRERGYNQSEKIAEGLSIQLNIPVRMDLIKRNIYTKSQTTSGKVDRWFNMDSVFEVTDPSFVRGKKIVIVDDVLTTGATVGMIIDILVKSGAASIAVICLAAGK
ncbi:ComF family protein [Marinoscillum sp. MHG1-6]|uniref:ComF family protein n=1 Tax=Marinoscillum sp. MHG1-6 TaxID=2959627 RepID=UPI0021579BA9|nr:ComF family protein [Marinoscillum sp. MHG1-6]